MSTTCNYLCSTRSCSLNYFMRVSNIRTRLGFAQYIVEILYLIKNFKLSKFVIFSNIIFVSPWNCYWKSIDVFFRVSDTSVFCFNRSQAEFEKHWNLHGTHRKPLSLRRAFGVCVLYDLHVCLFSQLCAFCPK